jgi:divalent metal cation (Fe/Co/Zn/Cd) transporter
MPDQSTRTVLVALGSGLGVAVAKAGAAVFTGSTALAAEAAHSLADAANDLSFSWFSVAAAAFPTISIPWGTGGKPTSGR